MSTYAGPGFPRSLADRYTAKQVLGAGGMGAVYVARDRELGREVAIKVIKGAAADADRARFLREAAAMARLKHPHLIGLYEYGETPEGPYMVMERLHGVPLQSLPREIEPMVPMLQVADALAALHGARLLHRDLKPQNIFWADPGRAVLLDLGLVYDPGRTALTRAGSIVGTLGYLAPEVMRLAPWTPASDWYGWGATLFYLEEGRLPVDEDMLRGYLAGGPWSPPDFEKVPPGSARAALLRACLDEDPAARPGSRTEVEAILADERPSGTVTRALLAEESAAAEVTATAAAPPATAPPPPVTPRARAPGILAALLVAVGLGLALARQAPAPAPADLEPRGANEQGFAEFRNPRDGAAMVLLDPAALDLPGAALLVDREEVTVARYRRFLEATPRPPPLFWDAQQLSPARPVVFVTRDDAAAYCGFAGGRLPTAAEWDRAAGREVWAQSSPRGPIYPWGEAPPTPDLAVFAADLAAGVEPWTTALRPTGGTPNGASLFGIRSLAGNVAEWCLDPGAPGRPARWAARGGSFASRPEELALGAPAPPVGAGQDGRVGFRCVRDPP